jgi:phage baseplate assembly protein W
MTEPITNFVAHWSEGRGIEMSWDAPADVTNGSHYILYYLKNAYNKAISNYGLQSPEWVKYKVFIPMPEKTPGAKRYSLAAPSTYYTVTWDDPIMTGGIKENSVAFKIIHQNQDDELSEPVYVFSLRPRVGRPDGAEHFVNKITVDSFGQMAVNGQDSYMEVADSVGLLLGTVVGQRSMVPGYGVEDMPLEILNTSNLSAAIGRWEPRANAIVSVVYTDDNEAKLSVSISQNGVI